jgi:perosamine synthetase
MFEEVIQFIRSCYPGQDRIPLHEPLFGGREKEYVLDCIDSTFVSSVGPYVDRFEAMLAEYTGAQYAVATVNGTAALHAALLLAGVQPGDEVITQPLTFVATANAIRYCGADPCFVDVDRDTLGLSPDALREFVDRETRRDPESGVVVNLRTGRRISACVPMHTFGHPCRIDEIVNFCRELQIPIIEDAAESIGSFFRGQHTGTFGDMGIFSFNGNKTITCGGGGAIVTNDAALARRAKHITTTAKVPHRWEFVHDEVGYNYRMPNINAALACAQLEQLNDLLLRKRVLADRYRAHFVASECCFIDQPENARSNFWLNSLLLPSQDRRDSFLAETNDAGVMTRPAWRLMNKLEILRTCSGGTLSVAEDLERRLVNVPSSPAGGG